MLVGGFKFQPIWNILVKMGIFPQVGVKKKILWNHHPAWISFLVNVLILKIAEVSADWSHVWGR